MIEFARFYTHEGEGVFESAARRVSGVCLRAANGEVVFHHPGVEMPEAWSETAAAIAAQRYFNPSARGNQPESSIFEMVHRVVQGVVGFGVQGGYFASSRERRVFSDELGFMLLHQHAAFNTPVWLNLGVKEHPQCSACFILAVDDSIESLLETQRTEGLIFKHGAGTGANLTSIRSCREKLSGGGEASGPVSFMHAYDTWAAVMQSGGRQRRAARMQTLDCDHPDLLDFICCKISHGLREQMIKRYPLLPWHPRQFEMPLVNTTISVRLSDVFLRAAETGGNMPLRQVLDGKVIHEVNAGDVLRVLAESIHACGEPGIQFPDTIDSWHTVPCEGAIRASNPCSEFQFVDNSACNLVSINLVKYLTDRGEIDCAALIHTVRMLAVAQDILVDAAGYPTEAVATNSKCLRPIGLGFTNLAALLMRMGLPYDSDEARAVAGAVGSLITAQSYRTSIGLAARLGPFRKFQANAAPILRVLGRHQQLAKEQARDGVAQHIWRASIRIWDEVLLGAKVYGVRNAQVTAIAPTGTISLLMDCDTTGIEPELSLVKTRTLRDGAIITHHNRSVSPALLRLGYTEEVVRAAEDFLNAHQTLEGFLKLSPAHLPIFDAALSAGNSPRCVSAHAQIRMVAAVQPHISGAISKTVNIPPSFSTEDILEAIFLSWRLGLKTVSFYRDLSQPTQPLRATAPLARHLRVL